MQRSLVVVGMAILGLGLWLVGSWGARREAEAERATLRDRVATLEKENAALRAAAVTPERPRTRASEASETPRGDESVPVRDPKTQETADAKPATGLPEASANMESKTPIADMAHLLASRPGSAQHRADVKSLAELVVSKATTPRDPAWQLASKHLIAEAADGDLSGDETADIAAIYETLSVDHEARPSLALAIAGGWLEDERLGPFLAKIAPNAQPRVSARVVEFLEDHPSAEFSDLWLRHMRDEKDPAVLRTLFDDTPVESAASSPELATHVMQAVETRILASGWDAKLRSRASYAIAVAGMRLPETGAEILRRLADREQDAALAEGQRKAAQELVDRKATIKGLEKHFK